MSTSMLSAGVSVNIMDFSDYVRDSSVSTVGMVGGAKRGPTGPTYITSPEQAIKMFGTPTLKDFGIFSLLAYLTKGDKIYYNRIVKQPSNATAGDRTVDKFLFSSLTKASTSNGTKIELKNKSGSPDHYTVKITPKTGDAEDYDDVTAEDIETKINGVSKIVTVRVNPDKDVHFEEKTLELSGGSAGCSYAKTDTDPTINFVSKYYDSTLDKCKIVFSEKTFLDTIDYALIDQDGNVLESYPGLSLKTTELNYVESYITNNSSYITCDVVDGQDVSTISGKTYILKGGSDGVSELGVDDYIKGIDAFSNPETTDIDTLVVPGQTNPAIILKGISVCESRQDALYIVDTPFGLNVQQVVDWSNCQKSYKQPDSSIYNTCYAAIYYPWVQIYSEFHKKYVWLPPSGYVAAQFAYNDKVAEPWFAPAGLKRGLINTVVGIEYSPTQGERDLLYGNTNVVNPIINFRQRGVVIWGQKTTQRRASALDRVNVVRLVNYLKKIITNSTYDFVFDPNDSYLWQKWTDMIEYKLLAIKAKRGLYDLKVVMDDTTVTVDDIENNRMPGKIMIKPTKTAEFIPLDFMIMSYGAKFSDDDNL